MRPRCERCGAPTDPEFYDESGGLCGYCLTYLPRPLETGGDQDQSVASDHG